jgi:hypothetical protein
MPIANLEMDLRFFITKSKFVTYEYSIYAERLGAGFVEEACNVIRHQRTAAGVKERTWIDNYVVRLAHFFEALDEYLDIESANRPVSVKSLKSKQWIEFGIWFGERIRSKPLAPQTKSKHILTTNKLFSILAFTEVIPVKIELKPITRSTKAKNGESRFTQKGWNRKPKPQKAPSPFEIRIEKHNRSYDYTSFQSLAPQCLLRMVPVLTILFEAYSASFAKQLHNALVSFFQYLKNEKDQEISPGFYEVLQSDNFKNISDLQWQVIIYKWRDDQRDKPRSLITGHSIVKGLALIWDRLAGASIVPAITIIGFKNAQINASSRSRRTLAQLSSNKIITEKVEQAVWSRLRRFFDGTEQEEALEFLHSLLSTIGPEELKALSIDALIIKIHELNSARLNHLRECAENDFLQWYAHWECGQAALEAATHTAEELTLLLDSPLLSVSERRSNSSRLLFKGPESCRLGNSLLYVLASKNGTVKGLHGRYHHLTRAFGGRPLFHAYLHPHPDATLALWVLLLIDTGANCEVVREMPWDCLFQSKRPNSKTLTFAAKLRSGGKIIYDEHTEVPGTGQKISLIQAIESYQRMAQRSRSQANTDSENRLFLQEHKGGISGLNEWTARSWFIKFMNRHNDTLGYLDARPSMIRPSVLMSIQHKNADSIAVAQVMADHSKPSTTLLHYTGRTPTKLKYNLLIREFQDRFQAVIIASIDGAAGKLGLTEEEFQRILSDAARTGLGVACQNPLGGVQPGTKPGHDCTRLDACWKCEMRWVVATKDNIIDLILFNEYLKETQDIAVHEHPEIWEKRWLPWLIFSDIALAKLSQGETAKIFSEANALAFELRTTYQPFPLF